MLNIQKIRKIQKALGGASLAGPLGNPFVTDTGIYGTGTKYIGTPKFALDQLKGYQFSILNNTQPPGTLVSNNNQGVTQVDPEPTSVFQNGVLDPSKVNSYITDTGLDVTDAQPLEFKKNFRQHFNEFSTKNLGLFKGIGLGADLMRSFLPKQDNSATTNAINGGYDAVANAAMMFGPVGTIVGGAMKAGGFVSDGLHALGGGTDLMTGVDKFFDSTPGTLLTLGMNGFFGKRTLQFSADLNTIALVGGSYGGTVTGINKAVAKAGKKYGAFSNKARRRANRYIDGMRHQLNIMTDIADEAADRSAMGAESQLNSTRYGAMVNNLFDPRYSVFAKHGIKLQENINLDSKSIEWTPTINLWTPEINLGASEFDSNITVSMKSGGSLEEKEWVPNITLAFKDGGKTKEKTQKNIIPEGNLHARLHHMNNDSRITKKGIPVIDNNGELLAEIELNEIIFTLEVTLKLEDLYHKFYESETSNKEKEELAIKAGKLLVEEILFNTEDRTGLINTLKQGGKIDGIS